MTKLIDAVRSKLPNQDEFSRDEAIANVITAISDVILENAKAGETTRFGRLGTFKTTVTPAGVMPEGTKAAGKAYPSYTVLTFDDSEATRNELTAAKAATPADNGTTDNDGA